MKFNRLVINSLMLSLFLFSGCDEYVCGNYNFVNSSVHRISVLTYREGLIVPKNSVNLLPGGSAALVGSYCDIGHPFPPFEGINDSIVVSFNDTLRVMIYSRNHGWNLLLYPERNPVDQASWREVKISRDGNYINFEYEFTNWHFEQAVAFSR